MLEKEFIKIILKLNEVTGEYDFDMLVSPNTCKVLNIDEQEIVSRISVVLDKLTRGE